MPAATLSLDELNAAPPEAFVAALDGVFEHAPSIAAGAAPQRPFATVAALHETLMDVVRRASEPEQLAFLRGHPALSRAATGLTAASQSEQAGLGLAALNDEYEAFARLSADYAEAFGFPFLICVRRHTPWSILRVLRSRIGHDAARERAAALDEIGFITRLRLCERVAGPGAPKTTGHLSTHVLDTMNGRPGEGVRVELFREGEKIREAVTDHDGRTPHPLVEGEPLRIGRYELRFHVGALFAGTPQPLADPEWYDVIPVRFAVAEPEGRYHVPLLAAPWSYTTYRGS